MRTTNGERYRTVRDELLAVREEHGKAVEAFDWPSFEGAFNWAHDWFDMIADGNDRTALHIVEEDGREQRHTFREMSERSNQVAHWLASLGVGRGDSVLVMLGNQVELWEATLAVMKLGAVVMPTTTALGAAELAERVDRGGAVAVIAGAGDAPKLAGMPQLVRIAVGGAPDGWWDFAASRRQPTSPLAHPGTSADDRLLLYFTSGTTSRPKMVEHTQQSYPVGHLLTMYWIGIRPGDTHLNISSPGWAKHAWSSFFAPWIAEATIFVYNYSRFDAGELLSQIRWHGVTTFCAPPTVWRMLIKSDLSGGPGSLREVAAAGEPLSPEVIDRIRQAWGLTVRDGFGQTETTPLIANTPGSELRPGSMGRPLPGVPVVLVDATTGEPAAEEGEICLDLSARPVSLMTGYQGDEERNAEAMAGGYYHTGDVATRDERGYLTYVGRTDDIFKASDYKVSPFELESVLIEHPAVLEAAVVPAPDPVRLAVPKAYIVLAPGWGAGRETAAEILGFAKDSLPPYLRVRRIEFFDLPKTISGKVRRVELREREEHEAAAVADTEWRLDDFPELRS